MRLSKQALAVCMVMKHSQKVLKIVSRTNEILAQLKSVCQPHFMGCSQCLLSGWEVMFLFNYTHPTMGERSSCFSLAFAGWVVQGAGQCLNPRQKTGASDFSRGTGRKRLAQMLEKEVTIMREKEAFAWSSLPHSTLWYGGTLHGHYSMCNNLKLLTLNQGFSFF